MNIRSFRTRRLAGWMVVVALSLSLFDTLHVQAQSFDTYLDPYKLSQVTLAGSHNTYEKKADFEYLFHAFNSVYLIEIDGWAHSNKWYVSHSEPLGNNNNCPKSGQPGAPRNQDLRSCIDGLRYWHDQNPNHPLAIVKIELKGGFVEPNDPVDLDNLIADLQNQGRGARIPKQWIFKPADLMCKNPPFCTDRYPTPEAAALANNWPTMAQLRGKFMFVLVPGTVADSAPKEYVDALRSGVAEVAFPAVFVMRNEDPRPNYYRDLGKQQWNVIFDLQAGRLDDGSIPVSRTDWLATNNFLTFVSDSRPWKDLGNPLSGFERLRTLGSTYKATVISTDQEKLCKRFMQVRGVNLDPICR